MQTTNKDLNMTTTIANETFKTQASVQRRCDAIKAASVDGAPIRGEDFAFLSQVLRHHPDFDLPAPMSEATICVDALPFGKRGFYVSFPDQTPTAVGVKKAVKHLFGKTNTVSGVLFDFQIAFRHAIAHQVIAKRREFIGHNRENLDGAFVSELSGETFPMTELAIDHTPPLTFDALLLSFVKEQSINPMDVAVTSRDGWTLLADDRLANAWRDYHQERAVLRPISTGENHLHKPRTTEWLTLCGGNA